MVNGAFSMERDLIKKMTVFLFCRDDVSIQNDHIRDVDWSSHPDFSVNGSPAVNSTTSSTAAATAWLSSPAASRKRRASALSGTMPSPTSLATRISVPAKRAIASDNAGPAHEMKTEERRV